MTPFDRVLNAPIPEPAPAASAADFVACLRASDYRLRTCARRLGCRPRLGVNFFETYRPAWTAAPDDPVDVLIDVLIAGHDAGVDQCRRLYSSVFVDAGLEMGLLVRNGDRLRSELCLFPCFGRYLVTDRAEKNVAINQVMYLWSESYILGGLVPRTPCATAVDLCTGSGIHAILASSHCRRVVGVDINPRAVAFARFNQQLNAAENISFLEGDLWEPVTGTCDLLLANPPYAPDLGSAAGDNFWSGGSTGVELLARVIRGIPDHLAERGVCHVIALYPNAPGRTTADSFDEWLGGALRDYEVVDHSWAAPGWADPLSVAPVKADKRAWRFGVISVRRAAARGRGYWRRTNSTAFFDAEGQCRLTADHDLLVAT